jgi:hypothetical protein
MSTIEPQAAMTRPRAKIIEGLSAAFIIGLLLGVPVGWIGGESSLHGVSIEALQNVPTETLKAFLKERTRPIFGRAFDAWVGRSCLLYGHKTFDMPQLGERQAFSITLCIVEKTPEEIAAAKEPEMTKIRHGAGE